MSRSRLIHGLYHMPPRLLVTGYLGFQCAAVAVWWLMLGICPSLVAGFHPSDWPAESLWAFAFSDGVMLVGGSAFAAWAVATSRPFASTSLWALAAAAWYPTLYCLGASCLTQEAWAATALMTALAGSTLAMATIQGTPGQEPALFRAIRLEKFAAIRWTVLQIVVFWGTFLVILPSGIQEIERNYFWNHFSFVGQRELAVGVIVLASGLGLASGWAMAWIGQGTPLPTAAAPDLVCSGPYRWVRNPMALAGIMQGLGVGLWLGSYAVIAYALLGAVLWHKVVRPAEDRDLRARFGIAYDEYCRQTGLWFPGWWKSRR